MANRRVRDILVKLTGDPSDAKRAVQETRQELRDFAGITAEARAEIKTTAAHAQLETLKERLDRLSKQEATPSVQIRVARTLEQIERIEAKLAQLGSRDVEIDVDIKRGALERLSGALSGVVQGGAAGLAGLLGNIPGIGGVFTGLSSSFGTTAIGASAATAAILGLVTVLGALAASLGAAIAGMGALAVAMAGAAGPAVLVTIAAFARFVAILKAVKDHQNNAGAQARGLSASQDQLAAATDAVSQAQANLREQATAAYRAWADAIETVKDDLLDVQHAQLGITQAHLNLRKAQQALKDFRRELGGQGFPGLERLTDVSFSKDPSQHAPAGAGKLSEDDSIKLQQLILDVKEAKLGEKDATDRLHDANTKLKRDRAVEADFTKRGIQAYKPYRDALHQVASAQRSLASAQRAGAAAAERQSKAWDDLSPAEKKFGELLLRLGDTFSKVFNPVMAALLEGVTKGLQSFATAASDPKVRGALVDTGRALGDAFADFAKTLTSPEMRRAFVDLAEAGVRITRGFATKVFADLALVLTRLAVATLPVLIPFLNRVADWFDDLERGSRNSRNLRDDVKHLVDVFGDWVTFLGQAAKFLLAIGRFLEPIGTGIVKFLTHPLETIGDKIGATGRDVKAFSRIFRPLRDTAGAALGGVLKIFEGFNTAIGGIVRVIGGVLTGDFREAWDGVKGIFRGAIGALRGLLEEAISPFKLLGDKIGGGIVRGIKGAFKGIVRFFEDRLNNLVDVANALIRAFNDTAGRVPGVHNIGEIGHIGQRGTDDTFGKGAKFPTVAPHRGPQRRPGTRRPGAGDKQARISSLANFAVGDLFGRGFAASSASFAGAPAFAAAGTSRVVNVAIQVPAGREPDAEVLAAKLQRKLERLGDA